MRAKRKREKKEWWREPVEQNGMYAARAKASSGSIRVIKHRAYYSLLTRIFF